MSIPENLNISSRGVDLNYQGNLTSYSDLSYPLYLIDGGNPYREETTSLVFSGVNADRNRVLFWLSTKPDDFIRSSTKGGILYSLLGKIANEYSLDYWKQEITRKFNEEFSDLILYHLNLEINKRTKTLIINMVIKDKLSGLTFPVNKEARL